MKEFSVKIVIDKEVHLDKLLEELGGKDYARISLARDGVTKVIKSAIVDETQIAGEVTAQTLVQDIVDAHSMVAALRDKKLDALRDMRDQLWNEIRVELNKHFDSHPAMVATEYAWKNYRNQLRDITNPYKDHRSDADQAAALDALDLDTYEMPNKPS